MSDFDARLAKFIEGCEGIREAHWARNYPNVTRERLTAQVTPRFIKVWTTQPDGTNQSIYCFIAREDFSTKGLGFVSKGDVMKPAGVKTPARGARGNIFADDGGLGRMGAFGPEYNR